MRILGSALGMHEAVDLVIEGRSPFPGRAVFIDTARSAGQETMHAACKGPSVVLMATDGKRCVFAPDSGTCRKSFV